jgi:hypothetical protein
MQTTLVVILTIHAILHLIGFLAAFKLAEFKELKQPISKTTGLLWLLAFVLLAQASIALAFNHSFWWLSALAGAVLSQVLIVMYWQMSKFGSIANIVIILSALLAFVNLEFKHLVKKERNGMFSSQEKPNVEVLNQNDIKYLPIAVQKWLNYTGVVGKKPVTSVYLTQELQLKLSPEQNDWYSGTASQIFTTNEPAFSWFSNIKMYPLISVVGRDKFVSGKGEMLIKLLAFFPVADSKNNPKTNQATLQRYLAEIVWFPSAAISPYITWEGINDSTAKAIMQVDGTTGSGTFYFNSIGQFKKFTALRFKDEYDTLPTPWQVKAIATEIKNNLLIPTKFEAGWMVNDSNWTWLRLNIRDIQYNLVEPPKEE